MILFIVAVIGGEKLLFLLPTKAGAYTCKQQKCYPKTIENKCFYFEIMFFTF
jgi:hypothetical protein